MSKFRPLMVVLLSEGPVSSGAVTSTENDAELAMALVRGGRATSVP